MPGNCELDVRFHQPPPDLERYFTSFCYGVITVTDGDTVDDAMQPEWGSLRFFSDCQPSVRHGSKVVLEGAGFVASGPTSTKFDYTIGPTRFWGLGLLPAGWESIVDTPARELADTMVDGERDERFADFRSLSDALLGQDLSEREELDALIAFFRSHLAQRKPADPRIVRIHRCLVEGVAADVKTMASHCALTERTLARLCDRAFGFPPKTLLRKQRFMRSLSAFMLDPDANWTGTIDGIYYDQSHFVRESHEFLGMSPSDYAALDLPILKGFLKERQRVRGSPVQTMDLPASWSSGEG